MFFCPAHLLSFGVAVEVIWPDVFAEHHIVVEVNELLREARDPMDVRLNGRGAETGKVGAVQEKILKDRNQTKLFLIRTASVQEQEQFSTGRRG